MDSVNKCSHHIVTTSPQLRDKKFRRRKYYTAGLGQWTNALATQIQWLAHPAFCVALSSQIHPMVLLMALDFAGSKYCMQTLVMLRHENYISSMRSQRKESRAERGEGRHCG